MRQLRYLASALLLCAGLLVPVGGFSQGRGNRTEHRSSNNNNHRGGGSSVRNNSNRGKEHNIKINPDRGHVKKDHDKVNRDLNKINRDLNKINKDRNKDFNKNHKVQNKAGHRIDNKLNHGVIGRPGNGSRPVINGRPDRGPVKVVPRPAPRPVRPVVRPKVGYHPSFVGRYHGWGRPLPPPPPRPARRYYSSAPLIDFGLGLVYGSLLNAGVNTLINAGLNVAATVNNAIYLSNVIRYGVTWPQVTMYYDSGRLSGARYQYGSPYTNYGVYDDVYNQLVGAYGNPLSIDYNGASRTATWWGGGNSGYVTLSFSPGYDEAGNTIYYTDLLYGQ